MHLPVLSSIAGASLFSLFLLSVDGYSIHDMNHLAPQIGKTIGAWMMVIVLFLLVFYLSETPVAHQSGLAGSLVRYGHCNRSIHSCNRIPSRPYMATGWSVGAPCSDRWRRRSGRRDHHLAGGAGKITTSASAAFSMIAMMNARLPSLLDIRNLARWMILSSFRAFAKSTC